MDCTTQKLLQEKFLTLTQTAPVAILGNGITAQGVRKMLEKLNISSVIYDQDSQKGEKLNYQNIEQHHVVISSPSFLSSHPWIRLIRKTQKWHLPELDFAGLWCPAPIVAITGTNGKTTTTSFLTEIFNHLGRRAFSTGNIGYSFSELVATENLQPGDIVFCETSSFQAECLNLFVPDRLIWTNFAPNHLDHHQTVKDYFMAKYRLVQRLLMNHGNLTNRLFCGESVALWAKHFHLSMPKETNYCQPKNILNGTSFDDFPQRENYAIVEAFCGSYGISKDHVLEIAITFKRPKYRLECMGIIDDNTYWNDSKCTNFAALKAALNHFTDDHVIWIGGGRSKGENLEDMVHILKGKVERAVLVGETGRLLEPILARQKIPAIYVQTIDCAIKYIKNACISKKNIVFSPAFSSFDQFKNYEERGEFFKKCIFNLKFLHHYPE